MAVTTEEVEPLLTGTDIIIIATGLLMIALLLGYVVIRKKIEKARQSGKLKGDLSESVFIWLYNKYMAFFLTESTTVRVQTMLKSSCMYTARGILIVTAKWETLYIGVIVGMGALSFLLYDDFVSILLVFIFSFNFAQSTLGKLLNHRQELLHEAFRKAISAVQEGFMRTGDVAEALAEAEVDTVLKPIFEQLNSVITGHNGELRLKEFIEQVPFRNIQIFAQVCFDIQESGDETIENGQSNFQLALQNMSQDVIDALERMHYKQDEFGNTEYLALVPLFCMKPLRIAMGFAIPALTVVYDSMLGYILRVGLLAISILAYNYIANASSQDSVKEDDRIYFFTRLTQRKCIWQKIAIRLAAKNYWGFGIVKDLNGKIRFTKKFHIKRKNLEKRFINALSRKTPEEFILEKYAMCFFLTGLIATLLYFSVSLGYSYIYNSTASLALVGADYSVEIDEETKAKMDAEYVRLLEEGDAPTGEMLLSFVSEYMGGLTDIEIQDEASRLETKGRMLQKTYYHWWFVVVAECFGAFGFVVPDIMLYLRKKKVQVEAEEDFLMQQTFMSIFMYTSGDTLDALEHLAELSKIHSRQLTACYYNYTQSPDTELAWLQAQTPLSEYKQFIGKMRLTTEDLSLREAFADLKLTREYIQKERDRKLRKSIKAQAQFCGILVKVPLYAFLFAYMVFPIGYVAVSEFMHTYSQLNF